MGVPAEEPRTCAGASHACVFFLDIPRGTRVLPSMHLHGLRGAVIFPLSGAFLLRGSGVGHVASLAGSASFRFFFGGVVRLTRTFSAPFTSLLYCVCSRQGMLLCGCEAHSALQPCERIKSLTNVSATSGPPL